MWTLLILLGVFGLSNGVPLESLGSRIIGGEDAPEHYAPHMVSLFSRGLRLMQVCGGSIITRRLVLTAAHCITPFLQDGKLMQTLYGRVGSNTWHLGGTEIAFKSHHIHPQWDADTIKNDVGILVLKELLKLGRGVAMIGLGFGWVGGDERCYVTGWGRTGPRFEENQVQLAPTPDDLQLLFVSTLGPEQCVASLSAAQWGAGVTPALDQRVEICTFHSVGHGMCNGDSGSALVSSATGLQIGVVSWGLPCARGVPDVFTRLSGKPIKAFIKRILQEYR